jgi:2-amino-4-hydroxy-6-hydroxymethyldihydropteridine diphosphokinase
VRVVLGLGSNLGDRLAMMRAGVERLRAIAAVVQVSQVWQSAPVGPPQPAYLNAAVLVDWTGSAHALLDATQAIEHELGRTRAERWGPRTIDIDLLWIDGLAVNDDRLVVPHPELRARAFALVPLLALVPDATDPATGQGYVLPENHGLAPVAARL